MLGYQLLDTLAWANSWPSHPQLEDIKRTQCKDLSSDMKNALRRLTDWENILVQVQKTPSLTTEHSVGFQEPLPVSINETATVSHVSNMTLKIAIENLSLTYQHRGKRHEHQMYENLHSAAFLIRWFTVVSPNPVFCVTDFQTLPQKGLTSKDIQNLDSAVE
jgi:hypothetical protein